VQPFAGFVAVTEYVPPVVTLIFWPLSAVLQLKFAPAALLEAVSETVKIVQFNVGFTGKIVAVGGKLFAEIVAKATEVQPFTPVAVTVKLPAAAAIWVLDKFPPPQLNVAAGSPLVAIIVAVGFVQVIAALIGETVAPGAVVFCEIVETAAAVQPFAGFVTVIVKTPAAETVFCVETLPPPQLNVALFVDELAVKIIVGVLHVICPEIGLIAAFGGFIFWEIIVVCAAVQPFAVVTVTA
jgi:hypothetical protein